MNRFAAPLFTCILFASASRADVVNTAPGDRNQIERVFDRNKGALYALYGRALRDNPKLQGRLVLEIGIDVAGKVTACRLKSSELNDPELERKIIARVNLIQFGPLGAPVTIVKAIEFFPA